MTAGRTVNSISQHWCTPPKYVNAVRKMYNGQIDFDPCSNAESIVKAKTEICLPEDGLAMQWDYHTIYVNPPYGADRFRNTTIKDWLRQCACANENYQSEVLALIPVATNTTHWKKYIFGKATSICFLYDTRLKFLIAGNIENKGAPMACCIVYWGERVHQFQDIFFEFGATVDISNIRTKCNINNMKISKLF